MYQLNDRLLLETYEQARKLKLNEDFLKLIEEEIKKRQLLELEHT